MGLTERARQLRRKQTEPEKKLWRLLRDRQFSGYKFRRQHPFGGYYLDFYCAEARLVLEVDGGGTDFRTNKPVMSGVTPILRPTVF